MSGAPRYSIFRERKMVSAVLEESSKMYPTVYMKMVMNKNRKAA